MPVIGLTCGNPHCSEDILHRGELRAIEDGRRCVNEMIDLPLPEHLSEVAETIRAWAASKRLIRSVRLFGSRVRSQHRPDSDLDIAIAVDGTSGEALATLMFEGAAWAAELQPRIGMTPHIDLAHRTMAPHVWSYLQAGSVMVYRRAPRRSGSVPMY